MASSEQLEREAEATRARIEATLAELRTRISPARIADQAIDLAREAGGGDFVRHLGRQVADNPLPMALMGAGLAWLMMTQRRNGEANRTKGDGSVDTTEPASFNERDRTVAMASEFEKSARRASKKAPASAEEAMEAGSRTKAGDSKIARGAYEVGATAQDAADESASLVSRAYERASEAVGHAKETTAEAYERAVDTAGRTVTSAVRGTRGVAKFMKDEPLVVAGLGIALGALVGALLPATEIENRTMGEASDRLKRDAREAAREQWERGKEMAEDGWDEAKEAARRTWEDAKEEAQKSWDATPRDAGPSGRADGHAADTTGAEASIIPGEETKSRRRASAPPTS